MFTLLFEPAKFFKSAKAIVATICVCWLVVGTQVLSVQADDLLTVAERSEFTATANGTEVRAILEKLASEHPKNSRLTSIGQTNEGREINALVIGNETALPADDDRMVVLLLGGIHSGECDGKEALLALARDLLKSANRVDRSSESDSKIESASGSVTAGKLLDNLLLIVVPNFSADAAERLGVDHRPTQSGPEKGMGLRHNAQDLDLNRDFIKLVSPEVRSLVNAIDEFNVDCLIDCHTTNGTLHRFDLTYDVQHNPAAPQELMDWLHDDLLAEVDEEMLEEGFETFYYGNVDREYTRWSTYGHQPRYSTDYMGMRNRIGILSESYAYASYETRVRASYSFVKHCLAELAGHRIEIQKLFAKADARSEAGFEIPLSAELAKSENKSTMLGYAFPDSESSAGEKSNSAQFPTSADKDRRDELIEKDYEVEVWNRFKGKNPTKLPAAYWIPSQFAWAADRLRKHGIAVHELSKNWPQEPEGALAYRFENVDRRDFQGLSITKVATEEETVDLPTNKSGFLVPVNQPLGVLAAYLLEPESDDSLLTWGFFNEAARPGELYPVVRIESEESLPESFEIEAIPPTEELTLERIYSPNGRISMSDRGGSPPRWLDKTGEYLERKSGAWVAVDPSTGSSRRFDLPARLTAALRTIEEFPSNAAGRYSQSLAPFNADFSFAMISHEGDLYVFNSETDTAKRVTNSPEVTKRLARLSPDGQKIAYVIDNDLYVVDCESGEETRLTEGGTEQILNGILDWVYQEEIYGRGNFKAFWWSPDSSRLAFLQLDQTPVDRYRVNDSITYRQQLEETRYPKSGAPLPSAEFAIADLSDNSVQRTDLSKYPPNDRLLVNVSWHPDSSIAYLQVQNRIQNRLDLLSVDATSLENKTLIEESSAGWIDMLGTPRVLPSGDFLWLSDLPAGRRHLFRVTSSGEMTALTEGEWDVQSIVKISTDGSKAFVRGNLSHPIETQLIEVNVREGGFRQVTELAGSHSVSMPAGCEYFADAFSNIETPPVTILKTINNENLRTLRANTNDHYKMLDIAPPELFEVTARDGTKLQSMLITPPGVDRQTPAKKYPVLIHVYGGPRAPTVVNQWQSGNYWWHQYLAQQGYFVLLCDNRSARGRGAADTWKIYKDLGRVELQDLSDAVGWLGEQPWADSERIGVWGWSYGGYFTSYALTHSDLFAAGIAGAPVTDWRNYDAIYTERYMDVPQNNKEGYESSSVVSAAGDLSGDLLIIHGERDDNVHMANTMQLVYALQNANKQFELMVYPKNRHGVAAPRQRYHMYQMMTDFLDRKLKGQSDQ